jgi:hypothetical protein
VARGWESKAVEDQQNEAEVRESPREQPVADSPEARERLTRLRALELSRARTLEQLERATNARHREMLRRTLASLEREIDGLG